VVFPTPPFWFVTAMINGLSPSATESSDIIYIRRNG
jgi:hypothetical protein